MMKQTLSALLLVLLNVTAVNLQAGEICKASMMGRICYNEDGSLRGESLDKKTSPEADKVADTDSKKVVAK